MTRRCGVILQRKHACLCSRAFRCFILNRSMSGPLLVGFLALSQLNLTVIDLENLKLDALPSLLNS